MEPRTLRAQIAGFYSPLDTASNDLLFSEETKDPNSGRRERLVPNSATRR